MQDIETVQVTWLDSQGRTVETAYVRAQGQRKWYSGRRTFQIEVPLSTAIAEGPYRIDLCFSHCFRSTNVHLGIEPEREMVFSKSAAFDLNIAVPELSTPAFSWPPPRATTRYAIDATWLGSGTAPETLGLAADRLLDALDATGYAEHSFFSIQPDPTTTPEGFVLVTRLEQIESDGSPRPDAERWSVKLPTRDTFSLGGFIQALFSAPEGHYRVIVFTVTSRPVAPSTEEVSRENASRWLGAGLTRLPPVLDDLPWARNHAATVLIYQFRQVGTGTEPEVNPPDAPPARDQLERTGILSALGG